jgi:hypothetical protein
MTTILDIITTKQVVNKVRVGKVTRRSQDLIVGIVRGFFIWTKQRQI